MSVFHPVVKIYELEWLLGKEGADFDEFISRAGFPTRVRRKGPKVWLLDDIRGFLLKQGYANFRPKSLPAEARSGDPLRKMFDGNEEVLVWHRLWLAKCPCHADHSYSLVISEQADGQIYLKCMGGCRRRVVWPALRVSLAKPATYYLSNHHKYVVPLLEELQRKLGCHGQGA